MQLDLMFRRLPAAAKPIAPGNYAQFGSWRIRQHRDELQKIVVGIAKVDRRRRHPGQHHRFLSWQTSEICRLDAGFSQSRRGVVQIRSIHLKGHMKAYSNRHGPRFPKAEHGFAGRANPKECNLALRKDTRQRKAELFSIKSDCPIQIADCQMSLEQVSDRNKISSSHSNIGCRSNCFVTRNRLNGRMVHSSPVSAWVGQFHPLDKVFPLPVRVSCCPF